MDVFKKTWLGYQRDDGRIGIRNKALIIYTSGCAAGVARKIYKCFDPQAVDIIGCMGCIESPEMQFKLTSLAMHQNVGGTLIISNSCEPIDSDGIFTILQKNNRPSGLVKVTQAGSVKNAIESGVEQLTHIIQEANYAKRVTMSLKDLIIGTECGGSDFTSGLAANALVGAFSDLMVSNGATMMFEEMYECVGLKDYLVSRCVSQDSQDAMAASYDRYFNQSRDSGQFFISPGNVRGGLTTIEEKSMGAVVKSGSEPIQGLVRPCQIPPRPGLWMMDAMGDDPTDCGFPVSNDASSTLLYLTCGAHLTILTSGGGHLVNNPIGPTFKITGNPVTYKRLSADTDFDSSSLLSGEKGIESLACSLADEISQIAAGRPTKGEALGHRESVLYYEKLKGIS